MRSRSGSEGRMGRTRKALRAVVILIFLFPLLLPVCLGQDVPRIPSSIKSPQDVQSWLSNFKYQMKFPDAPQSVEETLGSKAGDCDDLAKVVSAALTGLGISSDVLVIKTKGLNMRHAICIWKDENGNYSFFSNKQLVPTGEKSVESVLKRYFRNYQSFSVLSPEELRANTSMSWRKPMSHGHGIFH